MTRPLPSDALLAPAAVAFFLALGAPGARAQQCGAPVSECRNCHEVRGERPVIAGPLPWHVDHAFADLCARCHRGDPTAQDAATAHAGIVSPLADPRASCAPCHHGETDRLARTYAGALGTLHAPAPPPPRTPSHAAPRASPANAALAALVLALGVLGALAVGRRERAFGPPPSLVAVLRRPSWSPYTAGALLGVVTTVSMAVFEKRVSGSGAYQSLSGYVGRLLAPDDVYWRFVVPPSVSWEVWLSGGMFLGALASALLGREFAVRTMPGPQWASVFGPSVAKRWAIVFFGTALIEIAAGIAGGCTAGLAVSGGAVLAPGAFLFMAGMFGGGIPVARFLYRRRRS